MLPSVSVIAVLLLGCLCCVGLWESGRRRNMRLRGALEEANAGRNSLQRVARLAGRDLRDAALRLTGEAAVLTAAAGDEAGTSARLAIVAARCRSLADDLGAAGLPLAGPSLREDRVDLLACVRDAVVAVAATLSPGQRRFVLPRSVAAPDVCVRADLRAVREIVGRVLAEAAFNTDENDSIVIGLDDDDGALTLSVADEGAGIAGLDADRAGAADDGYDSRGLSAALTLARALMEAHGGRLEVISAPAAGTRVALVFPQDRRRR